MVKRIISITAAALIMLSSLMFFAFAANERSVLRLVDNADILTASQEMNILGKLNEESENLGYDINILTVTSLGDKSSYDYADSYYKEKNLGTGEKKNGFILLVSLEPTRHVQLIANGTPSKEYNMDAIIDYIMEDLRDAEYESAFVNYIEYVANNKGKVLPETETATEKTEVTTEKTENLTEKSTTVFVPFDEKVIPAQRQKPRLVDAADLISDDKEAEILAALDSKSEEYQFEIAIVTTPSTNGAEPMDYADDYYDYNGFGFGENRDGTVLLISMEPRYVYISTCGKGIKILSDSKWNAIIDDFYSELKSGDYEAVADIFIDGVEDCINSYKMLPVCLLVLSIIIGFIIASIIVSSMKKKNITVRPQGEAEYYVVPGSMQLSQKNDTFLYRNVSRIARPKETSSSGSSGGGTHTSSSGTSHGGGGRSF